MLLIDIYKLKEKDFHSGKTVKHCWEIIAKEMEKIQGYNIGGQKCCIKFQAMKRTYKSCKDSNKQSGNSAKKWEYFEVSLSFYVNICILTILANEFNIYFRSWIIYLVKSHG